MTCTTVHEQKKPHYEDIDWLYSKKHYESVHEKENHTTLAKSGQENKKTRLEKTKLWKCFYCPQKFERNSLGTHMLECDYNFDLRIYKESKEHKKFLKHGSLSFSLTKSDDPRPLSSTRWSTRSSACYCHYAGSIFR